MILLEILNTAAQIGVIALAILIAAILAALGMASGKQRTDQYAASIDATFRGKH